MNAGHLPMRLLAAVVGSIFLGFFATGCAEVSGSAAQGVNLQPVRSFYIVRDKQTDATDAVQKELARRGFVATAGPEASMPASADAKVLVEDHWYWDMTMYLVELKVNLQNPKTGAALASGRSYRPSLQRKPAEEMAREIFDCVFATAVTPPKQ
jgi:hypothetical protein